MAETLVMPTMFASAPDIPKAMAQVLLADMDKSGNMPHEKEIRAAAKAHGINLPKKPGKIETLARQMTDAVMGQASFMAQKPAVQFKPLGKVGQPSWLPIVSMSKLEAYSTLQQQH